MKTRVNKRGTRVKRRGTPGSVAPVGRVGAAALGAPGEREEKHEEGQKRSVYGESAIEAIRQILTDKDASATARAFAARSLAEITGLLGKHQQPPRERERSAPVSLLSRAELERELARLRAAFRGDLELIP